MAVLCSSACGDDSGNEPVDSGSASASVGPGDSGSAEGTSAASDGPVGTTADEGTACATAQTQEECEVTNPGGGHECGWVPFYVVTAEGEPDNLSCTFSEPQYICVQELGSSEGGTPFGSCGGDGSVPVYYRENGDAIELVATDGFSTPDGWSACDCHSEQPEGGDPLACCCSCIWTP